MNPDAPRLDWTPDAPVVGYQAFHPDLSLNFQCNRWLQWIGSEAIDEVAELADRCSEYPDWIDGFLGLAERARRDGRGFAGAYYDRAAEFFMEPTDSRRGRARARFLAEMRSIYGVAPELVDYRDGPYIGRLPAYDLCPLTGTTAEPGDTLLVFGGYDSYIEELLPMFAAAVAAGHRVIAFDGPGQGGALEDYGLPLTPEWEKPVAAVLDHFGIDHPVTAIGVSLGGGLVIRAAAFESRVQRVISFDILDDELEVTARQIGPGILLILRTMLALRAAPFVNGIAGRAAARKPVSAWGLRQGMHITGSHTPYEFLRATRATHTRRVSKLVTGDVLLLAGADDHYVPLTQLHRQALNLTAARSVTTRTFTATEQASNHCQIGNAGLAFRTCLTWLKTLDHPPAVPDAAASASVGR